MPTMFRVLSQVLPKSEAQSANGKPPVTGATQAEQGKPPLAESSVNQPAALGSENVALDVEAVDDDGKTSPGLHDLAKGTDYWFNYELSRLEGYAITDAGLHAQAGLPRQSAPADEELPVEKNLRARATELFLGWAAKVQIKTQDGIQCACVEASDGLAKLRSALARLEKTLIKISAVESALSERNKDEQVEPGKERTVEYRGLLKPKYYLILIGLLVLVDWVANVPVFTELLPQDSGTEQAWQQLVDGSQRYRLLAGLYRLAARVLFSPDVSLLALGVIIFLMFLGHVFGTSLRRIIAFRPEDEQPIALQLHSHRRQAWLPLAASAFGITLVLAFLFLSRGKLVAVTQARLTNATTQVESLERQLESADVNDMDKTSRLQQQLVEARTVFDERSKRFSYASGIAAMNVPIFLLNAVLVITAAAGAYLEANARFVDARLADPETLDRSLTKLNDEAQSQREILRTLDSKIHANIARARYLAESRPLQHWMAKAERLEVVIPLFRKENARLRGIDVYDIAAFKVNKPLVLPALEVNEQFKLPDEIKQWESELRQLRKLIDGVEKDAAVASDDGATR